jgi:hypothetical protein
MADPGTPHQVAQVHTTVSNPSTPIPPPDSGLNLTAEMRALNVASHSAGPSQAVSPVPAHQKGGGTSPQGASRPPAVLTTAPPVSRLPVALAAIPPIAPQVNTHLHVNVTHLDNQIHQAASVVLWGTFLGTPAEDRLNGIALDYSSSIVPPHIVVTGFTGPAQSRTLLLANFTNDGTAATVSTLSLAGSFGSVEGIQTAVDAVGTVYVSATTTDTSGNPGITLFQFTQDLTTAASITLPGRFTATSGGLHLDGAGNLYATGEVDGNLAVYKAHDLANWPNVTPDYYVQLTILDDQGNPAIALGSDIGANSAGTAFMAITRVEGPDRQPGVVSWDGTSAQATVFQTTGPINNGYGLDVDGSDNVFLSGTLNSGGPTALVAQFDRNLNLINGVAFFIQGSDTFGYGIQADPAGSGNVYVSRVYDDFFSGLGYLGYSVLNVRSGRFLDDQRDVSGIDDDQGRHLVLDTTNQAVMLAGASKSPDLFDLNTGQSITTGTYQPANAGGYDGVVIQYGLF